MIKIESGVTELKREADDNGMQVRKKKKKFGAGAKKPDISTKKGVAMKRKLDSEEIEDSSEEKKSKVDWKQLHIEKKNLKIMRKQQESGGVYEISVQAKQIWEELRRDDCPKQRQLQLSRQLHNLIKGKIKELIYAHDTVRVIECLMSNSDESIRTSLFIELQSELLEMTKSKYAHFFVLKLLRHGTKPQRQAIVNCFSGKVVQLMQHRVAVSVVEEAYNQWATGKERSLLRQEFYGPKLRLFKDQEVRSVTDAIAKAPTEKADILKHLRENLQHMLDKEVYYPSLLHSLLYEFLSNCEKKERSEMIEQLRETLVHMVHTRDGARVAMICLWHGTTKDRKFIIKSFKTHVSKICMEEHGHMVLLALFDCVDDTILVKKAIVSEIVSNMKELAFHEHGRKVILYLLAPRNTIYFHPQIVDILKQGDNNENSKKDPKIRHKELLEAVSGMFLEAVSSDFKQWTNNNAIFIVVGAIFKFCTGPQQETAFNSLVEWITQPFTPGDATNPIENVAGHIMLKKIILMDKEKAKEGHSLLLSTILSKALTTEHMKTWISCNRGAFLLVLLIESEIPAVVKLLQKKMVPVMNELKTQTSLGAKILQSKLEELH